MRKMKKYHLAHHYKNFELGFGVTSALSLSAVFTPLK
jgi:4-hydroxysphinganine ceramide fatty acyl 2-hydroxylase